MTSKYDELAACLAEPELACDAGAWSCSEPDAGALQSTLPFCVDTLALEQWLQFVCLPQMQARLAQQAPLPSDCAIAPMAEQSFSDYSNFFSDVVRVLRAIDQLLRPNN